MDGVTCTANANRIWSWLPARCDSRRVTLPATIAAALDLPVDVVMVQLRELARFGYVVRDSSTGTMGGWHRGKALPAAEELPAPPE